MAAHEAKLKEEERIREEQAKLTGKPVAKAPAPAKVQEVPEVRPFTDD